MPTPSTPKVSIMMPIYNSADFLPQALESVLQQTFTDFELVVSDNASSDDGPEIVRRYAAADKRIRLLQNEANIGAYPNYNRCFRALHPDSRYLADHPSDDWWAPDFLATMVQLAERHPEVTIVHSDAFRVDENGNLLAEAPRLSDVLPALPPAGIHQEIGLLLEHNYLHLPAALLNREQLRRYHHGDELYDPSFAISADYLFVLRVMLAGAVAYHHPEAHTYYRRHEGSLFVRNQATGNRLREEIVILEEKLTPPARWREAVEAALARRYADLGMLLLETQQPDAVAVLRRARNLDRRHRLDLRVAHAIAGLPLSRNAKGMLWNAAKTAARSLRR